MRNGKAAGETGKRGRRDSGNGRTMGVLVVEDDPDLQWRLARMLTVQGSRVVGTSTGKGALALIAQWPVDLVLIDDGLPGMSGLEVARKIHETYPAVTLVLMTSVDSTEDVTQAAHEAGVMSCVEKPFESDRVAELLASVQGNLDRESTVPDLS